MGKNNINISFGFFFFMIICFVGATFCGCMALFPATMIDFSEASLINYDAVNRVSCSSDSMGQVLDCGDLLYISTKIISPEQMVIGDIYTFNQGNSSIVHRLIKCMDNCTKLIFKGDNNRIADPIVSIEDVTGKVIMVKYR